MEILQVLLLLLIAFVVSNLPAVFDYEDILEFFEDHYYLTTILQISIATHILVRLYVLFAPIINTTLTVAAHTLTALEPFLNRLAKLATVLIAVFLFLLDFSLWLIEYIVGEGSYCSHINTCRCFTDFVSKAKYERLQNEKDRVLREKESVLKMLEMYRGELEEKNGLVNRIQEELDIALLAEPDLRRAFGDRAETGDEK